VGCRLASHCAQVTCPDIGPSLAPLQLAVGVSGVAQTIGDALAAGVAVKPECTTVQLDIHNAFNAFSVTAEEARCDTRLPTGARLCCLSPPGPTRLRPPSSYATLTWSSPPPRGPEGAPLLCPHATGSAGGAPGSRAHPGGGLCRQHIPARLTGGSPDHLPFRAHAPRALEPTAHGIQMLRVLQRRRQ
jgi:hypothetical protein